MSATRWPGAAVLLLGGAAALLLALVVTQPWRTEPPGDAVIDGASDADVSAPPPLDVRAALAPHEAPSGDDPAGTGGALPEPTEDGAAPRVSHAELVRRDVATVESWGAAEDALRAAEEAGEEDAAAREEARAQYRAAVERLTLGVRGDAALASDVLGRIEAATDAETALRLARILRVRADAAFVADLRRRALESETPLERRAALVALETRDAEAWLEPAATAYLGDDHPDVRDEAAGILGRSLVDPKYVRESRAIRATIEEGLSSADSAARARALRTMLAYRSPSLGDLDRVRAFLEDEDAAVRAEAARTLRVLDGRRK